MRTWLRRLARIVRPGRGRHRGRPSYLVRREALRQHEVWIGELLEPLERTPPAEARPAEPWQPRITRWVRLACPQPDDTIIMVLPWAY